MIRLFSLGCVLVVVCGMAFSSCKKDPVPEGQQMAFRTTSGVLTSRIKCFVYPENPE